MIDRKQRSDYDKSIKKHMERFIGYYESNSRNGEEPSFKNTGGPGHKADD